MSSRFQVRKGNTAQNDTFTGAVGELTYDTQKKQIRVHDGSTVGGKFIDDTTRDVTGQVKQATESLAGKAKIATTAIAQAGVNDADIITPKKLFDVALGCNQKITNVASLRVANTYYLNSSNRSIEIILSTDTGTPVGQNFTVVIKDVLGNEITIPYILLNGSIGLTTAFSFILAKGEAYKLNIIPTQVLERV